jgi:hypothetical protein
MRRWIAAASLLAAACASSPAAAPAAKSNEPQPEIQLTQLSNVADAARHMTGGVSVQYRVTIHNTRSETIKVRRVDMQSVGMGAYTLPSFSRAFDDTLGPNETKSVDVWGAANIDDVTIVGANGPVTIRTIVRFEDATGRSFQSVVVQQVQSNPSRS